MLEKCFIFFKIVLYSCFFNLFYWSRVDLQSCGRFWCTPKWFSFFYRFPSGSGSKVSACSAGNPGSIPGLGRSPGEGNGNPLQYSCLENSMDGGAWWATVHGLQRVGREWARSLLHIYILPHIPFHSGLWQGIEYSSLCCEVGPSCLSILSIRAYTCKPQTLSPPFLSLQLLGNHKSILYACVFLFHT